MVTSNQLWLNSSFHVYHDLLSRGVAVALRTRNYFCQQSGFDVSTGRFVHMNQWTLFLVAKVRKDGTRPSFKYFPSTPSCQSSSNCGIMMFLDSNWPNSALLEDRSLVKCRHIPLLLCNQAEQLLDLMILWRCCCAFAITGLLLVCCVPLSLSAWRVCFSAYTKAEKVSFREAVLCSAEYILSRLQPDWVWRVVPLI